MNESEMYSARGRKYQIVFIGLLSMFFAEVCSGASILWFVNLWSLLVTFPLYWSHILFFFTLAVKTKRTSIGHLYLWGVLFGLYESWVTKVVWAGYFNTPPAIGPILGFAFIETIVIVLFWHPVFSFIAPILTFEILSIELAKDTQKAQLGNIVIPSHLPYITKNRRMKLFLLYLLLFATGGLSLNSGFNVGTALITLVGTYIILWIVFHLGKRKSGYFSIYTVSLRKRGLIITAFYIILLYSWSFFTLRTEKIPSPLTVLLTIGLYAFIAMLIFLYKPHQDNTIAFSNNEFPNVFTIRDLQKLAVALLLLIIAGCVIPPLGFVLFLLEYYLAIGIGLSAFLYTLFQIAKIKKQHSY